MLEAAFVLGVVTATDPPAWLSDTVPKATQWGGCELRFSGIPVSPSGAVLGRYYPLGGSPLPAQLLPPYVTWEPPAEGLSQT